jgi:hypothetical protein
MGLEGDILVRSPRMLREYLDDPEYSASRLISR